MDADPVRNYRGGVFDDPNAGSDVDHVVSVVGWGKDSKTGKQYWIARNSWGEYWGEMGYFRVAMGGNQLGLESECAWAVPKEFTTHNVPCGEAGEDCAVETSKEESQQAQEGVIVM